MATAHGQHAWRLRAGVAVLGAATLFAGVAVRMTPLHPFIAKYAGVALWSALVFWMVVFVAPRLPALRVFVITVAVSWAVELFQLTPYPRTLASVAPLSRWVLGTTFHAPDLAAYVLGAGAAGLIHGALQRRRAGAAVHADPP